jgi:hypothetical protein
MIKFYGEFKEFDKHFKSDEFAGKVFSHFELKE